MDKKKIAVVVAGFSHSALMSELVLRGLDSEVILVDAKEELKELQKSKFPTPEAIKITQISSAQKQKKDKSGVKRYSSYFNKKRP